MWRAVRIWLSSRSSWPRESFLDVATELPHAQAAVRRADYPPHPLSMRVERWVAQHAPDEACRLVFRNRQQYQAISRVAMRGVIEPIITREEREPLESPKKRNDFSIAHS